MQDRVRNPQDVERLLQQMSDGGFTDAAEQNRADGDAELGAGQHQRELFAGLDHRDGAFLALFGERFQPIAAGRDQRELGADEECVGGQ